MKFVFLSRENAENDFKTLEDNITNDCGVHPAEGLNLVMFPEGTNMNAKNLKRSLAWADKTGAPKWESVLLPRHAGFVKCVQVLIW